MAIRCRFLTLSRIPELVHSDACSPEIQTPGVVVAPPTTPTVCRDKPQKRASSQTIP